MTTIAENLELIGERIRAACARVGRDPAEVQLVGVTKTVPIERIREGVEAGLRILGENYIQEVRKKIEMLADLDVSWHFIGHLQSNKAKLAVEYCDWIHSVDSGNLARELDKQAQKRGKRLPVLIQVNIGDETTKSGVSPRELLPFFRSLLPLDGLVVCGLMAIPPYCEDPEEVRPYFSALRGFLERLRDEAPRPEELTELSMGMSQDFETAIEEGATFIRVGTAIFGERS
ncbi:MAG: YggS family pyridoxal phosphate-dependent enzyme [Syntrophobacteraceae bacterium]